MKKKSIMALGLAAMLTVGMSVPAMAATGEYAGDESGVVGDIKTEVTLEQKVSYTIKVPATATMTKDGGKIEVELMGDTLLLHAKGKVTCEIGSGGTVNGDTLTLTDTVGGTEISSKITADAVELNSLNAKKTFTLEAPASINKAGDYRGEVVFTIGYNDGEITV